MRIIDQIIPLQNINAISDGETLPLLPLYDRDLKSISDEMKARMIDMKKKKIQSQKYFEKEKHKARSVAIVQKFA